VAGALRPPLRKGPRIAADEAEVTANPRARSAWLRVAERVEEP
jgi:16S rRNA C1402 N4-methylase RsmH